MIDKTEDSINQVKESSKIKEQADDSEGLSEVKALFTITPDHAKLASETYDDTARVMRLFAELRENELGNPDSVNRAIAWMEFLSDFLMLGGHLPRPDNTPFSMAQLLDHDALAQIAFAVMSLRSHAVKPDADSILDGLANHVGGLISQLLNRVQRLEKGEARDAVLSVVTTLASRYETLHILDEARIARRSAEESQEEAAQAATEAKQSAVHVKEVAGEEAVGELSNHFSDYAKMEQRAADIWRIVAVVVLLGSSAAALWLLHILATPDLNTIIRRVVVTLPLAVVAGYAIHEASDHRKAARWAHTIAVQLRTVRAFTDPLPDETRDAIRAQFGLAVFSVWPIQPKEGKAIEASPAMSQAASLIERALEMTKK